MCPVALDCLMGLLREKTGKNGVEIEKKLREETKGRYIYIDR
jgi:hypothetical protein